MAGAHRDANAAASACSLNATENVQGRLNNGVPAGSVCGTAAGESGPSNQASAKAK